MQPWAGELYIAIEGTEHDRIAALAAPADAAGFAASMALRPRPDLGLTTRRWMAAVSALPSASDRPRSSGRSVAFATVTFTIDCSVRAVRCSQYLDAISRDTMRLLYPTTSDAYYRSYLVDVAGDALEDEHAASKRARNGLLFDGEPWC